MSGSTEERIADIAGLPRGRVARRQLLAAGISGSTVDRLVSRHRLIPRLRGVFAVGHAARMEPFDNWRLDFYWPQARFAVEVDSYRFHSSRYRFERDRRKDKAMHDAGIEVMRIVDHEIDDRSHAVVADITRALARRGGSSPAGVGGGAGEGSPARARRTVPGCS